MTRTKDTKPTTFHFPEPWTYEFSPYGIVDILAPDTTGEYPQGIYVAEIDTNDVGRFISHEQHEANAYRICAAVNACQGISTEALERGVIADLRHVLGEIVTAAGDLDAAIDGATGQFNAERNRLKATLRAAQSVLHSGMALDLHELLANRGQVALIWSIKDVQEIRPELSDERAWEVLDRVEHKHDATLGVTWDTLETVADDLFGDAPETDSPE